VFKAGKMIFERFLKHRPTLYRKWVWQRHEPKQNPGNLIMDSDSLLNTVVGKWCSFQTTTTIDSDSLLNTVGKWYSFLEI
jgi:hypothetical protein